MAADGPILIFQKKLTPTDINHGRLSLPTHALQYLPPFAAGSNRMIFPVLDEQTRTRFNFECWRRARGHPKPVISGGWREYVRVKGLMVGDDVALSMVDDDQDGVRYNITVIRRSLMLFGYRITTMPDTWLNL